MKAQKICITGALGYIGSELCKIYSGEARYKDIVCIDNRFISERVKQLTDWGMTFIQGDILNEALMQKALSNADIIYHLAGITDVAYVATEANEAKDKQIQEVGVAGTKVVIKYAGNAKLIFPSTHVVYGALPETEFEIDEERRLMPDLTYAKGKAQSEHDIASGTQNYIIVRLGSVYGYSGDTMRINIMPNLFSKITSQNGTIKLFGSGLQHKSLVNIIDVVRAMKFLAESENNRETYHVSNENMTVWDVALLCKWINPNVELVPTDDEVPNKGYTLSNKKLLGTGFKFLYNIDGSLREMIKNWSAKPQPQELEYIQNGQDPYFDDRGSIYNYELTEPINLIGLITSKRGTVRANHYHPIQEQKCLLMSGLYVSVIKDLADPNRPIEMRVIRPGNIAVIRPNVAHAMVFLQDSVFLNLVRGEREHKNYGITHTIPYEVVNEELREDILNNYKVACRSCHNTGLQSVVNLGMSPLANNLTDAPGTSPRYLLEMMYCPTCHNCQLSYVVPAEKMFDNYLYTSSTAASFRKHFEDAADKYITEFQLNENSLVVDIGSNDGVFLKPLQARCIRVLGVEPAKNLAEQANASAIPTLNAYFTAATAIKILSEYGKADLITASNVFAHADDLASIAINAFNLLKADGILIIEVQYLIDTIKDLTFDNIYHEHTNYWTVTSLVNFFQKLHLYVNKVEHINTHGGSIRCYISKKNTGLDCTERDFLKEEERAGVNSFELYRDFGMRVAAVRENVRKNIEAIKKQYPRIAAYGSPAKATTCLNYFGINFDTIQYTIEDNPLKQGKFIPGVDIPIVSKDYALQNLPDVIIVLAWNFYDEIVKNNRELSEKGVRFISIKDLHVDASPKKTENKMARKYVKHVVGEMDGMIQRCVVCGEVISDYTNALWPSGQEAPKGFEAGEIYVSSGQPVISTKVYPDGDEVVNCDNN